MKKNPELQNKRISLYSGVSEVLGRAVPGEIETMEPERRMVLVDDLNRSLKTYTDDHGVDFPMETYKVMAKK